MDIFLKRVTPPQEEPEVDLIGGIPEESIPVIGEDSSMFVIAPEDLLVGQDVEVEDTDINYPDAV